MALRTRPNGPRKPNQSTILLNEQFKENRRKSQIFGGDFQIFLDLYELSDAINIGDIKGKSIGDLIEVANLMVIADSVIFIPLPNINLLAIANVVNQFILQVLFIFIVEILIGLILLQFLSDFFVWQIAVLIQELPNKVDFGKLLSGNIQNQFIRVSQKGVDLVPDKAIIISSDFAIVGPTHNVLIHLRLKVYNIVDRAVNHIPLICQFAVGIIAALNAQALVKQFHLLPIPLRQTIIGSDNVDFLSVHQRIVGCNHGDYHWFSLPSLHLPENALPPIHIRLVNHRQKGDHLGVMWHNSRVMHLKLILLFLLHSELPANHR